MKTRRQFCNIYTLFNSENHGIKDLQHEAMQYHI